jgi:hypothetical protein
MRAMRGFTRLFVVMVTAMTLLLLAAVGAAAGSGSLGSGKAVKAVVSLVAPNLGSEKTSAKTESKGDKTEGDNNGKHTGECHPPKKTHKHGTPGHKNHPCGEDGDDTD